MGSKSRRKRDGDTAKPQTPLEMTFDKLIKSVDDDASLDDNRSGGKPTAKKTQPKTQQELESQGPLTLTSDQTLFAAPPLTYSFAGLAVNNNDGNDPSSEPAQKLLKPIPAPTYTPENSRETSPSVVQDGGGQAQQLFVDTIPRDGNDDTTRDRQVKFIEFPENRAELTVETKARPSAETVLVPDEKAVAALVDGTPVAQQQSQEPIDEPAVEGDENDVIGHHVEVEEEEKCEENMVGNGELVQGYIVIGDGVDFFVEEEEEDDTDDDTAEPPPIPEEVIGNAKDDESEYDTELEFDASDDSSAEPQPPKGRTRNDVGGAAAAALAIQSQSQSTQQEPQGENAPLEI
jgi:hypothetical protein